eukprot:scaffold14118_cov78-Phaeocystis_antarctica.AAC.1
MPLKGEKNLPGLRPGPADPRSGTGCAREGLPWICMGVGFRRNIRWRRVKSATGRTLTTVSSRSSVPWTRLMALPPVHRRPA